MDDGFGGTELHTLGCIEEALTFPAFGGDDDVIVALHGDGGIGAIKLTGTAGGALAGDNFVSQL
jgi:hypothetical protein